MVSLGGAAGSSTSTDAPDSGAVEVVCALCRHVFIEDRGQATCQGCPLAGGCHFRRCPYCGYENPVAPVWLQKLRQWLGDSEGIQRRRQTSDADSRPNSTEAHP